MAGPYSLILIIYFLLPICGLVCSYISMSLRFNQDTYLMLFQFLEVVTNPENFLNIAIAISRKLWNAVLSTSFISKDFFNYYFSSEFLNDTLFIQGYIDQTPGTCIFSRISCLLQLSILLWYAIIFQYIF